EDCVNSERFEERVVYVREGAGYRLKCPLDPSLLGPPSSPQTDVTWLKDCHELPPPSQSLPSGLYLDFPTLGSQDMGNYTCVLRNTTTSFTVHLIVRGAFK
ncbi:hypothetical protein CRUP_021561, partial [Coryphaenoides rupestris]